MKATDISWETILVGILITVLTAVLTAFVSLLMLIPCLAVAIYAGRFMARYDNRKYG